jgi:hypothetical protein
MIFFSNTHKHQWFFILNFGFLRKTIKTTNINKIKYPPNINKYLPANQLTYLPT